MQQADGLFALITAIDITEQHVRAERYRAQKIELAQMRDEAQSAMFVRQEIVQQLATLLVY